MSQVQFSTTSFNPALLRTPANPSCCPRGRTVNPTVMAPSKTETRLRDLPKSERPVTFLNNFKLCKDIDPTNSATAIVKTRFQDTQPISYHQTYRKPLLESRRINALYDAFMISLNVTPKEPWYDPSKLPALLQQYGIDISSISSTSQDIAIALLSMDPDNPPRGIDGSILKSIQHGLFARDCIQENLLLLNTLFQEPNFSQAAKVRIINYINTKENSKGYSRTAWRDNIYDAFQNNSTAQEIKDLATDKKTGHTKPRFQTSFPATPLQTPAHQTQHQQHVYTATFPLPSPQDQKTIIQSLTHQVRSLEAQLTDFKQAAKQTAYQFIRKDQQTSSKIAKMKAYVGTLSRYIKIQQNNESQLSAENQELLRKLLELQISLEEIGNTHK